MEQIDYKMDYWTIVLIEIAIIIVFRILGFIFFKLMVRKLE